MAQPKRKSTQAKDPRKSKVAPLMQAALLRVIEGMGSESIDDDRLQKALANWAVAKMGKECDRYMELAVENFVLMAAMKSFGSPVPVALGDTPFVIPTTLPKESPLRRLAMLFGVYSEYETLVLEVKRWKTQSISIINFRLALKENLVGGNQHWIDGITRSTKPSDIATMYLINKYKLKVDREALKKWFAVITHPKRLTRWVAKTVSWISFPRDIRIETAERFPEVADGFPEILKARSTPRIDKSE